jgi:hypothetical protein
MTKLKKSSPQSNTCIFCEKSFSSERTLQVHKCVKKQRYIDRDTVGSRMGFRVFQRFYELSTTSKNQKDIMDFISSRYYIDFVKFGRHLVGLNPVDTSMFVDYVIKNSIPMDDWCKDRVYYEFLKKFIETETVDRALERTVLEMESWCSKNNSQLSDFFNDIGTIEITFMLRGGKISPWVLYLSSTSQSLLSRMTEEQGNIIKDIIDPTYWGSIFSKREDDVRFAISILKAANL